MSAFQLEDRQGNPPQRMYTTKNTISNTHHQKVSKIEGKSLFKKTISNEYIKRRQKWKGNPCCRRQRNLLFCSREGLLAHLLLLLFLETSSAGAILSRLFSPFSFYPALTREAKVKEWLILSFCRYCSV